MESRTLLAARNPQWGEDRRHINLECKFKEVADLGFLPFTASLDDQWPHGVEIFALARQGKFGPVADYQSQPAEQNGEIS